MKPCRTIRQRSAGRLRWAILIRTPSARSARCGSENPATKRFSTQDLLVLNFVHDERRVSRQLQPHLIGLVEQGIVEAIGRGRSARYMLSCQLYTFLGRSGVYTRKRGLDRQANKALLLKHITDNEVEGSQLKELMQVLPALSRDQVQKLLQALRSEGLIYTTGTTRGSRWFPVTASNHS